MSVGEETTRRTEMRIKVLASSLTKDQVEFLKKGRFATKLSTTAHLADRLREKGISKEDVIEALRVGVLIEFHTEAGTRRTLWRNMKTGVCVVLDHDERKVVTAWRNDVRDNHLTIDLGKYMSVRLSNRFVMG